MEEFRKDVVAFEGKNTLEEGMILHIIQYSDGVKTKQSIDLSFDAFKQLVNLGFNLMIKYPRLNEKL